MREKKSLPTASTQTEEWPLRRPPRLTSQTSRCAHRRRIVRRRGSSWPGKAADCWSLGRSESFELSGTGGDNPPTTVKDAVSEFQRQQMEGANIVPARIANGHIKTKDVISMLYANRAPRYVTGGVQGGDLVYIVNMVLIALTIDETARTADFITAHTLPTISDTPNPPPTSPIAGTESINQSTPTDEALHHAVKNVRRRIETLERKLHQPPIHHLAEDQYQKADGL